MNIYRMGFNALVRQRSGLILSSKMSDKFYKRLNMSTLSFDMNREKTEFINALPGFIEDIGKHPKFTEIPVAKEWMQKVLNGTLVGGKAARGLTTVMSYKMIENPEKISKETIRLAHALGWCVELLQSYCVVLDDIMDGSSFRRGMPCWYRREDVGMQNALNDSILIHYCLNYILKDNFENSPFYIKLYQTFNENFFYASIGQFLDIRGSQHKNNYELFTRENYDDIVKFKSSYYTYKLPISIAFMLANKLTEERKLKFEDIYLQLGRLFQMQDDYIDCFGDEHLIGKNSTDIQEGKCTWLAVTALPRCNSKNRTVFEACYGSKEPAHVERVKQLYVQLEIPQIYKQEQREIYDSVLKKIKTISSTNERNLFRSLLEMLHERKK